MRKYTTWVVKLGGAMMHARELGQWLEVCNRATGQVRCVIVAGGGSLADEVRELQRRWSFSDRLAHQLAITAMAQNAHVLSSLIPAAAVFSELSAQALAEGNARCSVWIPLRPALDLPETWGVTSDSIALRVAQLLKAENLVLVKSSKSVVDGHGQARDFANEGLIDSYFPELASRVTVPAHLLSKDDSERFGRARSAGQYCGTRILAGC